MDQVLVLVLSRAVILSPLRSLLAQLQQLRSLIKQTASKGAQTSTCLLVRSSGRFCGSNGVWSTGWAWWTQPGGESEPLSVCPQILLVSLSLIVLPSFSPFSRRQSADDDYRTAAGRFGPIAC